MLDWIDHSLIKPAGYLCFRAFNTRSGQVAGSFVKSLDPVLTLVELTVSSNACS